MNRVLLNRRYRYVFCAAFAVLSLLLLGAGRLSGESGHRTGVSEAQNRCSKTLRSMASAVPGEQRNEWIRLLQSSPELAVRIHCTAVVPVSSGR